MSDDLLTETRLRTALGARPFRFEPQVGSTNDLARDWALNGTPAGSVVLTEEQIAGRGRFGRAWSAPPGTALLMSIVLRPRITPEKLPRVTMVGAVAVADALLELAPDTPDQRLVQLKWPNDVWLAGRKVAGVLPEAIWQGASLSAVILGIGLNIRIDFGGSPLVDQAISLETVINRTIDRAVLLNRLLNRIDYWSMRLDDPALFAAWRNRLDTLGQRITARSFDVEISGTAENVDENGALLIRADDGTIHRVIAGEVTLATQPPAKG